MVPVVEFRSENSELTTQAPSDRRKQRQCAWKEIRLCTAHNPNLAKPRYGVCQGSPLEVGCMMKDTCRHEGMHERTHIHGVADGALWIADQYETQFGTQHHFLIDYYHACEYLSAASHALPQSTTEQKNWYQNQKSRLLESQTQLVLQELENRVNKKHQKSDDQPCAITQAYKYLKNRESYLDYAAAREEGLPIGSGEVESAHRSILQDRLKLSGAWWLLKTATGVAHLRVLRANQRWHEIWEKLQAA